MIQAHRLLVIFRSYRRYAAAPQATALLPWAAVLPQRAESKLRRKLPWTGVWALGALFGPNYNDLWQYGDRPVDRICFIALDSSTSPVGKVPPLRGPTRLVIF